MGGSRENGGEDSDGTGDEIGLRDGGGGGSGDGRGGGCRDGGGAGGKRGGNGEVENKENKDSRHVDRGDPLLAGMEGRL